MNQTTSKVNMMLDETNQCPNLFSVIIEKGWEVFTEIESEETIIPRTIKITKAPHKEKEEDDEDEKPTEAKQTKKPKEEDDDEGPGKKIGEEVSIKLPKQVRKSNDPAFYKN
ncbi:unnamed protein product [Schistosoma guineensis]|nr:unnamed protein product [Schistosoma guineensis]